MLEEARAGRSGALVVRGDAGIGKSTLLEYAVAQAGDARVVRALGVETESEFAYSGLHELVRPLLDRLPELPPVQADALRGALALAEAQGAGRLYIGAATLSLLAAARDDGPLLCVIDDVHWLDEASAGALAFAARRLEAEGVVMLFAARGQGIPHEGDSRARARRPRRGGRRRAAGSRCERAHLAGGRRGARRRDRRESARPPRACPGA